MRLLAARWLVPVTRAPVEDGAVAIDDDGRLAYVGPRADAPPCDDVEDLGDAVLLPGLVNAHTHLELTAMRGLLEHADFFAWIRTLTRARAEVLDDAALADASRLGVLEGLSAGVTTFADTSASGAPLDALIECGARGIVYQEVFGPDAAQREASMDGLRARVAALRARATALVRVGVSPHAVYSVHEELLLDACAWALGEGLPIAMHVSESAAEIEFLREGHGPFADFLRGRGITVRRRAHSPVHLLAELGIAATARPLLIHGVRFDDSDVALAAHYDCPVAHCPASNAKLGHGVAPLRALLDAGVRVGLGTDSVGSNNRLDLLEEARVASLLQRAVHRSTTLLAPAELLRLCTLDGARALGLDDRIGTLEPGKDADLCAVSLAGVHARPVHDPVAALFHSARGSDVVFAAVRGRALLRDGSVPTIDGEAAGRRLEDAAARLRGLT